MRDEQPLNYSNRLLPALPPTQPLPAHPPAPEVGSAGEGVAPNLSPQLVLHNLVGALHAPLALGVPNRAADVPDAVHLAQLVEDAVAKLGAIVGLQDAWRHRILPEEIHLEGEGKEDAQKSWMAC